MSDFTIPTIEELEAETANLNTRQLHELSSRTKAELALAQARISESHLRRAIGERASPEEINQMNLSALILRARSEHLRMIYGRRSEQRSVSSHQQLEIQVAALKAENKELKAEIERLKKLPV